MSDYLWGFPWRRSSSPTRCVIAFYTRDLGEVPA